MEPTKVTGSGSDKDFFPRGAIAFFFVMIGFYAALWLTLFWIMSARA